MIVALDHITFSSSAPELEINFLRKLGYGLLFYARQKPNLKIKKDFMRHWCEKQDLALLTSDNNISIELVRHTQIHPANNRLLPLFRDLPIVPAKSSGSEPALNSEVVEGARLVELPVLKSVVYHTVGQGNGFDFTQCVLRTDDVDASRRFFELFGFQTVSQEGNVSRMDFVSVFKKKARLTIIGDNIKRDEERLDDAGFTCLAFLVNDAAQERKRFLSEGLSVSAIESINIHKKILEIFFVRGFAGELAEVISPKS